MFLLGSCRKLQRDLVGSFFGASQKFPEASGSLMKLPEALWKLHSQKLPEASGSFWEAPKKLRRSFTEVF
jgi:hypothetical protein